MRPAEEGTSVLVVDDEPVIVDLLLDILQSAGYRTDTAGDGREACHKVAGQAYDAVITDVRMPRMDGIEFYRRIIEMRPEMKGRVIFVTGDLMNRELASVLAETGALTIPKPLEIHRVVTALEQVAGREPALDSH